MSAYLPLLAVLAVVIGFALRLNPLLVVIVSGVVAGIVAGRSTLDFLALLGNAFLANRYLALFILTLPVIGLLERHGLREHAENWIARMRGMTVPRLLVTYQALRQGFAAIGLPGLGGHAQTVRPLLAPMAEATADVQHGPLPLAQRMKLRAWCAATDNVALFFGEDIFIAFGAVLLMQAFLATHGIALEPLQIALWGIPTGIAAFAIHAWRVRRMSRRLAQQMAMRRAQAGDEMGILEGDPATGTGTDDVPAPAAAPGLGPWAAP
jgi:uncharacterized membrane protein